MEEHEVERFLQRVFERYPEWKSYLTLRGPKELNYFFLIQVPSPVSGRTLDVYWPKETGAIYSFGGWHAHCSDLFPRAPEAQEETFWRQIDEIMSDEILIINYIGKTGSTWRLQQNQNLDFTAEKLPVNGRSISWSGHFDFSRI